MNWEEIKTLEQLDDLDRVSDTTSVLIFKHSTRCSISEMAIERLERDWNDKIIIKPYYLDLLAYRTISDAISKRYVIEHQSPQVLLIVKGKCIYNQSHSGIRVLEMMSFV